jgi:hypothetical protein
MTFDPPHREDDSVEVLTTTRRNFLHTLVNTLSQRRLLVLTSAVTGVILVFLGLVISGTPTNSTAASTDESSISPTSQIPKPDKVSEPTEAAIDFVLGGQVPGLTIPGDLTRDSLSATVVSTSGEIVLVDVQAEQPEGLTTFATLLLQKSGATWRIREVFDPR